MNLPEPFKFDLLSHPWALLLWGGVVVLFLIEAFARAPGAINLSTGEALSGITRRFHWPFRLPALLRAIGLGLLVVALAGPLNGFQVRPDRASVVDIMLCLDVSGSMQQQDFLVGGRPRDRLFAAKEAVRDFIQSRRQRGSERFGMDRVGLVLYAGYAWTQCPLTLDFNLLEHELEQSRIVTDREKDGTAIGSALGLAVRRLGQSEAKSKVVILLTDGLNNRGELDPLTAAKIAAEYGIRVYTIGAGATEEEYARGGLFPMRRQAIDEEALKKIADLTGGKYYHVMDLQALRGAYAEINALETTEIEAGDYYQYREAFIPWALSGLAFLTVAVFIRRAWFDIIP